MRSRDRLVEPLAIVAQRVARLHAVGPEAGRRLRGVGRRGRRGVGAVATLAVSAVGAGVAVAAWPARASAGSRCRGRQPGLAVATGDAGTPARKPESASMNSGHDQDHGRDRRPAPPIEQGRDQPRPDAARLLDDRWSCGEAPARGAIDAGAAPSRSRARTCEARYVAQPVCAAREAQPGLLLGREGAGGLNAAQR